MIWKHVSTLTDGRRVPSGNDEVDRHRRSTARQLSTLSRHAQPSTRRGYRNGHAGNPEIPWVENGRGRLQGRSSSQRQRSSNSNIDSSITNGWPGWRAQLVLQMTGLEGQSMSPRLAMCFIQIRPEGAIMRPRSVRRRGLRGRPPG